MLAASEEDPKGSTHRRAKAKAPSKEAVTSSSSAPKEEKA
jgi:hypothetical protein